MCATGCRNELYRKIAGFWSIDEITYKDESIYFSLFVNTFLLKLNGESLTPAVQWERPFSDVETGEWELHGADSIYILTTNPIFGGRFHFYFEKDYENKLLIMVLENDDVVIRARKGMWNFDADKNWHE